MVCRTGGRTVEGALTLADTMAHADASTHPSNYPLIGMVGYARSGKDTAAAILVQQLGYQRLAFADPLKELARYAGWNGVKDDRGRHLLQQLGAGVRNVIGSDTWVEVVRQQILADAAPNVVTDVRYDNEMEMLRELGGQIWLIERPGVGPVNAHVSEQLPARVATNGQWDARFDNAGTVADFHAQVVAAVTGSSAAAA